MYRIISTALAKPQFECVTMFLPIFLCTIFFPYKNKKSHFSVITVDSLLDGHLWDQRYMSMLERCMSAKRKKERQRPTLGVHYSGVKVTRELNVILTNFIV